MTNPSTGDRPAVVYRLFDASDRLLYVGMTYNLKARFAVHSKLRPWWPEVARVDETRYETRTAASDAETFAINIEKPIHNDRKRLTFAPERFPIYQLNLNLPYRAVLGEFRVWHANAPGHVAERVGLELGADLLAGRRIAYRDGAPVLAVTEWHSRHEGGVAQKWYRQYAQRMFFEHREASPEDAEILGVPVGETLDMLWTGTGGYGENGRTCDGNRDGIIEALSRCGCKVESPTSGGMSASALTVCLWTICSLMFRAPSAGTR